MDHVIAEKHGGQTVLENLALSCLHCNAYKGPNIAGVDPDTGKVTVLFHPRRDDWNIHFRWEGAQLVGRTPVGRTTVAVLKVNLAYRVVFREALRAEGTFIDEA